MSLTHEQHVAAAERLVADSKDAEYLDATDRANRAAQAQVHATLALAIAPRVKAPAQVFLASIIQKDGAKVIHAAAGKAALVNKLVSIYSIPAEWQGDIDTWADYNGHQIRWVECEL